MLAEAYEHDERVQARTSVAHAVTRLDLRRKSSTSFVRTTDEQYRSARLTCWFPNSAKGILLPETNSHGCPTEKAQQA